MVSISSLQCGHSYTSASGTSASAVNRFPSSSAYARMSCSWRVYRRTVGISSLQCGQNGAMLSVFSGGLVIVVCHAGSCRPRESYILFCEVFNTQARDARACLVIDICIGCAFIIKRPIGSLAPL